MVNLWLMMVDDGQSINWLVLNFSKNVIPQHPQHDVMMEHDDVMLEDKWLGDAGADNR